MTYAKFAEKHQEVAALTWEEWFEMTLKEKRTLLGGLVTNASRMKTAELTEEFERIKESLGQRKRTDDELRTVDGRAQAAYRELVSVVRQYEGIGLCTQLTRVLAVFCAEILSEPDKNGQLPVSRLNRSKFDLFEYIDEQLEDWDAREQGISETVARDRFKITKDLLRAWISPFERKRNLQTVEQQKVKLDNREEVDVSGLEKVLDLADRVLNNPEKASWQELSTAIAIATGRRQGEVHSSGEFVPAGPYTIRFSGQLKKRRNGNGDQEASGPYDIPSMFPAEKVARAWSLLVDTGRYYPDKPLTEVNNIISKPLQRFIKTLKGNEKATYHELRDHYALLAELILLKDVSEPANFMRTILGHEKVDTTLSYRVSYIPQEHLESLKKYHLFGKL